MLSSSICIEISAMANDQHLRQQAFENRWPVEIDFPQLLARVGEMAESIKGDLLDGSISQSPVWNALSAEDPRTLKRHPSPKLTALSRLG